MLRGMLGIWGRWAADADVERLVAPREAGSVASIYSLGSSKADAPIRKSHTLSDARSTPPLPGSGGGDNGEGGGSGGGEGGAGFVGRVVALEGGGMVPEGAALVPGGEAWLPESVLRCLHPQAWVGLEGAGWGGGPGGSALEDDALAAWMQVWVEGGM